MNIYIPNQNDIIHETSVDFVLRPCAKEIHIVQYDKSLPIVKVELFRNGERYVLPESDIAVNVRLGKLDHTFVYKSILGTNQERNIIYFEIDEQMALIPGRIWPVIEVIEGSKVACSSPLCFIIERNPIQEGQIESHDDFPIIYQLQGTVADHEVRITVLESQVSGELVTLHTDQYNIDGEKTFNNKTCVLAPGSLELYFTPTESHHAVTKGYVDDSIETIELRSDVIDIVGTYQDLLNYDTTKVGINDLIKVISDSTHNNSISYYRWVEVSGVKQWSYVASEGPFYTISQTDDKFVIKASYDSISGNKDFSGWVNFNVDGNTAAVRTTQVPSHNNDITPKWYVDTGLSDKLDKVTSTQQNNKTRLYIINSDGTQGTTILDELSLSGFTIPLRTSSGNINLPAPTVNSHATNKEYVDSGLSLKVNSSEVSIYAQDNTIVRRTTGGKVDIRVNDPQYNDEPASKNYVDNHHDNTKLDKVTSTQQNNKTRLYIINSDGTQGTTILDELSLSGFTIPLRTSSGNINLPAPTVNSHATNKEYVDGKFNNYVPWSNVSQNAGGPTIVQRKSDSSVDIRVPLVPTYNNEPTSKKYLDTELSKKVTANTAITGATKCKITYDSKGLVTSGEDLVSSDIPDLSTIYVALTGDQTINGSKTFNGLVYFNNEITAKTINMNQINAGKNDSLIFTSNYSPTTGWSFFLKIKTEEEADPSNAIIFMPRDWTYDGQTYSKSIRISSLYKLWIGGDLYDGTNSISVAQIASKTSVTLNGTAVTSANIYAPVNSGASGQVLQSNGGGQAPTWVTLGTGGTVTKITAGTGLTTTLGSHVDGGDITASGTLYLTKVLSAGDTKCKITYDEYGRVTAGANLATSDLPSTIYEYIDDNNSNITSTASFSRNGYITSFKLSNTYPHPGTGNLTTDYIDLNDSTIEIKDSTNGRWLKIRPNLFEASYSASGTGEFNQYLLPSKLTSGGVYYLAIASNSDGSLSESDIPSLAASKITSGKFADARISSANYWNTSIAALFEAISGNGHTVTLHAVGTGGGDRISGYWYITFYYANGTTSSHYFWLPEDEDENTLTVSNVTRFTITPHISGSTGSVSRYMTGRLLYQASTTSYSFVDTADDVLGRYSGPNLFRCIADVEVSVTYEVY